MFKVIIIGCILLLVAQNLEAATADLTPCLAQNWITCGFNVGSALYDYYNSWEDGKDRAAFGTVCKTQFRGSFYRWQWVWSGHFWCPSISATIKGYSPNWKSREGAYKHAMQDWVTQAGKAGVLSQEQIANYNKANLG
jgi:hypothetical protein